MNDAPCTLESIAAQQTKNELQLIRDDGWADVRFGSKTERLALSVSAAIHAIAVLMADIVGGPLSAKRRHRPFCNLKKATNRAPKSTPAEIINKLNNEINAALADPKMKSRLATLGGVPMPTTPADFERLIADETEKWAEVIKFTGIKAD